MSIFEKEGWVSVWVGVMSNDKDKDVLKDLCGVDNYDVDYQEVIVGNKWKLCPTEGMLNRLSFSDSFLESASQAAASAGLDSARFVVMQLDYKYDSQKAPGKVSKDPVFIGSFKYKM